MSSDMLLRAVELFKEILVNRIYPGEWDEKIEDFLDDYNNSPRLESSDEYKRQFEEYRQTQSHMVAGDGYQTK